MKLEEIITGLRLSGVIPHEVVEILFAQAHGKDAFEITYRTASGSLGQRVLFRRDEEQITVSTSGSRGFDAPAYDFKMAAEAQRIKLAGLHDPMLAVATSNVQALPHQIRAVYDELLPRSPLRFLLADDPGAGKTIMAGLFIKELILREDVHRCLVVAPGGLVEQWQDELFFKFGLRFEILTTERVDASLTSNVFDLGNLLIARMDQVARNDDLLAQLRDSQWDLVVVDEAHRMGAHYFGNKLVKTKRFQLGELLGDIARHFLLMTATPHSGKEEDFQLFLSLLDKDRFAGKNVKSVDTSDIMRRMTKENLLTFEGNRLFPERIAESIPYELTELENDLYEQVTDYVRNGMNRAAKLLDGKRRSTVGFALTVLQRRLASSPEAIYRSLLRRADRLEMAKQGIQNSTYRADLFGIDPSEIDEEAYSAEQIEEYEEDVLDAATAAETIAELEAEIVELKTLAMAAKVVRDRGDDKKWSELSLILEDNVITPDRTGKPRKLIIFTEHRDTLNYLTERIQKLIRHPKAVVSIHGGVRRHDRRAITEEFTKNPECRIMLATDAAGEGLNLQAAHLMVNYDLPWNPNRIEQRFGRIHRIGQEDVCRLWNLVASNTREGEVFTALLNKIEEQRKAYGGKVFDVLGTAFADTPLRELLIEAIRYGDQPEVRARMHEVIDNSVSEGLEELLNERALASENFSQTDLASLRAATEEAQARRLQPHYIELAFKEAFTRFGGRVIKREKGRYELSGVPAVLRNGRYAPIASRYDRVTFDLNAVQPDGLARADLLAPGHPLHDAVMEQVVTTLAGTLNRGTALISNSIESPQVLVGVIKEVVDATDASVARRFGYAYVAEDGTVIEAGPAPYLDFFPAPSNSDVENAKSLPWLHEAESAAVSWIIEHELPDYLSEIQQRRITELEKQRVLVSSRLKDESERLMKEAVAAEEMERFGERPKTKESSSSLANKAAALQVRLDLRTKLIDQQANMSTKPPVIVTAALVLPASSTAALEPIGDAARTTESKAFEKRALDYVLASERALGREARTRAEHNNPGYQMLSTDTATGRTFRILVKAQPIGSTGFWVTHNEVVTGKNAAPMFRLALVQVDPDSPDNDEVRYLDDPFSNITIGTFEVPGQVVDWTKTWSKGRKPF
ncbi:MAG: DEAD/DEAH box helicase family protein [Microthrixaceae bacterium]|nr:DEAD/DEAH box helicase family protein [Microthrixaceae bacterium]